MRWRHLLLICLAGLSLAACEPKPGFNTTDVSGADFGPGLHLPDHNGQLRTLADFRGKAVAVFFGYTNCPDVCPTSLAMLLDVQRQLGPDADRVQVLFVTVDPQRDTAERLKMYMNAFDPRFLGLVGTEAEVAILAKEFKVFYEKHGDIASGRYSVDHTAGCYIFDPQGRPRLFARHGETASRVAADIKLLLAEK
ncbi:SCO family protein [Uliginosibacterium flavum]|uniref:SCO family protein n=1 Tax=Uliginosibacterium flavum TaxID=1396831 RepID=A0ABV2TPT2_9RHOO